MEPDSISLAWEASNDDGYHVWQLSCSVKDYTEGLEYTTLENELSDGFWSQILYGSNTGVRSFSLTLPTVTDADADSVVGPYGEILSKRAYLRALHAYTVVDGRPFVIRSTENGQYYLVRFAERKLSLQRMLTKLYSTGLELKQVRLPGVTVFDPSLSPRLFGYWDSNTSFSGSNWAGTDGSAAVNFAKSGDVADVSAEQNNNRIKRFNLTTNNGYINADLGAASTVYDIILVMKMRETTFSNDAAMFSNAPDAPYLTGDSATTKFTDPALDRFSYFLNGVEYAASNMQAPMNRWGVVHFRNLDGWDFADGFSIGNASGGGGYPELDLGDVVILEKPDMQTVREITESLIIKWAIGAQ